MRGLLILGRCDEIKKEVLFMFEECEINTYPIDCFAIPDRLYYQLRLYSSLPMVKRLKALAFDMDGYSRVEVNPKTEMNEYVIYYNDYTNQERIRWTILHEIGHVYLGHHGNSDDSLSAYEEAEANFFAKYSIALPPLINVAKCTSPDDVAATFDVSGEASFNIFDCYKNEWNSDQLIMSHLNSRCCNFSKQHNLLCFLIKTSGNRHRSYPSLNGDKNKCVDSVQYIVYKK